MNLLARRFLLLATGLCCAAFLLPGAFAANRPAGRTPVPKAADRFVRTKERIDVLLKSRQNPDPLPAVLPNPFQLPAGMAVVEPREGEPPKTDPGPTTSQAPTTDAEFLALYAASLKLTGTVKLNGQSHLIINQSPYKEGDLILLNFPSKTVYLQVIRITADELTLGLNQAVQTIKFKF